MNPHSPYDLPDDWQYDDVKRALRYVRNFTQAVDCGAHRGIITRLLLTHFGQVHAIEPTELAVLIPPEARIHRVALGAASGFAWMRYGKSNSGESYVQPEPHDKMSDMVPLVPLDDLRLAPGFIKLDVEGMELNVLLGGEKTIREHRPVILFEDNGLSERYGIPMGAVGKLLESWGAAHLETVHHWRRGGDHVYGWR